MSSLEHNKEIVRRYVAAFNRGDIDTLRTLYSPDALIEGVLGSGGLDDVIPIWRDLHAAFGVELTVEEMVAEADRVAVRYTERGTFVAPFRDVPPTGRSYVLTAMEWFVFRDGRIQRRWGARDAASHARQVGLPSG